MVASTALLCRNALRNAAVYLAARRTWRSPVAEALN
jgi:hypothetical protein